jgi:ribosomal-protein-alanine N-acetyltransferase
MNYFIDFCKRKNVCTIFLEVNTINSKAISLYEKFGFARYGIRKKYYGENDAVLMKLDSERFD